MSRSAQKKIGKKKRLRPLIKKQRSLAVKPGKSDATVGLVDLLDRLLDKGAVVEGEVAIKLADVDLIYLNLRLLVTSISRAAILKGKTHTKQIRERLTKEDIIYMQKLEREIKKAETAVSKNINGSKPEDMEKGLARLVLTLVELIRRLVEREAVRQVKINYLTSRETQKLGMALNALAKKMEQIRKTFGLDDDELNLDLGPLGKLF
jgi:hypothetical protein